MADALIVGGGVGGVAAALALRRFGWRVTVLEKAGAIAEVGAGLQISPNGFKVLEALGLGPEVEARAYEPERFSLRLGRSGAMVFSIPSKQEFRRTYGAPYLQVHRADLLDCLVGALAVRAPDAVRTGCDVETYCVDRGRPRVRLSSGETLSADLLVGADGVRSSVRDTMLGPDQPRFTGNVAWRAVVEMAAVADLEVPQGPCVWAGAGRHAVTYPLRGGRLLNFVGVVEQEGWDVESWTQRAPRGEALADFAGWSPLILRVLREAPEHFRWALFDRAPLERWTDGPVALLGDACHPMLPTLAQGACQALEDAWTLATCASSALDDLRRLPRALVAYETARKPRTTRMQRGARGMARLFHLPAPLSAAAYAPLWAAGRLAPNALLGRNAWIYAHDVTDGEAGTSVAGPS